jgi:hypothetical protein
MADKDFSGILRALTELFAPDVLPDLIPSAAAIGIPNWCWRNDTAVEDWHLLSDALMTKVSISTTRAVMEHVDSYEGIDWQGAEESLTSEAWKLPDDGRSLSCSRRAGGAKGAGPRSAQGHHHRRGGGRCPA